MAKKNFPRQLPKTIRNEINLKEIKENSLRESKVRLHFRPYMISELQNSTRAI